MLKLSWVTSLCVGNFEIFNANAQLWDLIRFFRKKLSDKREKSKRESHLLKQCRNYANGTFWSCNIKFSFSSCKASWNEGSFEIITEKVLRPMKWNFRYAYLKLIEIDHCKKKKKTVILPM